MCQPPLVSSNLVVSFRKLDQKKVISDKSCMLEVLQQNGSGVFFFVFFCYLFDLLAYFIRWLKVSWNRTIHEKLRQECLVKTCKSEVLNLAFLKKKLAKKCRCVGFFGLKKSV